MPQLLGIQGRPHCAMVKVSASAQGAIWGHSDVRDTVASLALHTPIAVLTPVHNDGLEAAHTLMPDPATTRNQK